MNLTEAGFLVNVRFKLPGGNVSTPTFAYVNQESLGLESPGQRHD